MKKLSSIINEIRDAIKNRNLTGSIYSITLIAFLLVGFILYSLYLPDTLIWMVGTALVTALIHFIIYFLIALNIDLSKEGPFIKQYNKVMEEYEQTNDPKLLHEELTNIKFLPVKIETKNAYNLSMSTALYRINRTQEALTYLDKIETDNKSLLDIVEEQRKLFKRKK